MKKLVFVPLELIEDRYSLQWYYWFKLEFEKQNVNYVDILPNMNVVKINQGEFLDCIQTNIFKAQQLQEICQLFEQKKVDENTVFLIMDAWFPGLEMLGYLRATLEIPFKIVGLFHAGTWDDFDFLTRCGVKSWGKDLELSWLKMLDAVCVATQFHKDLILEQVNYADSPKIKNKIYVTGFPIFPEFTTEFIGHTTPKLNRIVFPHRLAFEKQPHLFDRLELAFKDQVSNSLSKSYTFIKTKECVKTKEAYYSVLNSSKIAVSFANQETFGIAMLESVLCGCIPIVPNRLSYAELYPDIFKYDCNVDSNVELQNALTLLNRIIQNENFYKTSMFALRQNIVNSGMNAIPNILNVCKLNES